MSNPPARFERIAFLASLAPEAGKARDALASRYGDAKPEDADVIVPLGGDGFMLRTLHKFMTSGKPFYGMHRGTVGFLMNEFREDGLRERLAAAETTLIRPLVMRARDEGGQTHEYRAINEVSLFRQIYQAARLKILVDGKVRLDDLVADGVLVATPAGSTHPDQPVPAPPLARRAAARQCHRHDRGARVRTPPGRRRRRPRRGALGHPRRHPPRPGDRDADAVRPRPQPRRTDPARAVRSLKTRIASGE
jgi:hypothetical protein